MIVILSNMERYKTKKATQMTKNENNIDKKEAREAISSVTKMHVAGLRRSNSPRWFGLGISLLSGSIFAIYALDNPYSLLPVIIIGLGLFIALGREKMGVFKEDFPTSKKQFLALAIFVGVLLVLFFGGIVIRRSFDLSWVPIITGFIAGAMIYLAHENARRNVRKEADLSEKKIP